MVMVAACGDECRTGSEALSQLKPQHIAIEAERTFEVCDFQVDVTDGDPRVDFVINHRFIPLNLYLRSFIRFYCIDFNGTTPGGKFTLKEGECFGACGDAPVCLLNNKQMLSFMSNDKIDGLLAELK